MVAKFNGPCWTQCQPLWISYTIKCWRDVSAIGPDLMAGVLRNPERQRLMIQGLHLVRRERVATRLLSSTPIHHGDDGRRNPGCCLVAYLSAAPVGPRLALAFTIK